MPSTIQSISDQLRQPPSLFFRMMSTARNMAGLSLPGARSLPAMNSMLRPLDRGGELTIASVAEPRKNEPDIVEPLVDHGHVDRYVGQGLLHLGYPLGSRDDRQQLDTLNACRL